MVRPDKVAVVDEIGEKLSSAKAAVLTEYRGLSVPELAELRSALREAGTHYKVYKNTLARRAVAGKHDDVIDLLEGPVAWAFIDGDVVTAAKALRDFSKDNEALVIKGALFDGEFITADKVDELAQLPTRDELMAKLAGGFKAPLARAAGLFSALQRNTAYAVKALIDKRVEAGEEAPPEDSDDTEAAPAGDAGDDATEADAPAEEASDEDADDKSEDSASPEAGDDSDDAEAEEASAAKSAEESGSENGGDESETSEASEDDADAAQEPEADESAEAEKADSEGDDDQTDEK